jgi:hypothetical protein
VDARHKAGHVSHNISAMTDISANIFALLILILIIMLAARENSPTPRVQGPQVIDVEKDVAGVERSPLSSEELIELLYERRERASSTKIDLLEQEIVVSFGGKTEHFGTTENAVSRLRQIASVGSPAGVYVQSSLLSQDIRQPEHLWMGLARNIRTPSAESVCRRTTGMVCRFFRAYRAFIRSFAVPRRPRTIASIGVPE